MHTFGRFNLTYDPLELHDGRRLIRLPAKQLEVLALLVQAQVEVVSRETFLDKIWDGSFVEESNLTQTIFLLRRTLGKLPNGGTFIETVPRLGYRLAKAALNEADESFLLNAAIRQDVREADQLRLLVQSFDEYAIYMLDCAGVVTTWNPGAEQTKGYWSEEIIGQHFSVFFVPEDIEARVPDRELAMASSRGKAVGEGWRLRKNGERFWASYAITAIRSQDRRLLGFGKVVRDLTDHKKREDALSRLELTLRRERDRMRAVAESSMDAIFVCEALRDADGEIYDFVFTYLNHNVTTLVSIPREELLRGTMCQLLPINVEQGFFSRYKDVVLTGVPYSAELALKDNLISSEWLSVRAVKLGDGLIITASDITARKRAEEELRRYDLLRGQLPEAAFLLLWPPKEQPAAT